MEIDECSVNGDSGAEEDDDEELSQGTATESSTESSGSNTTTDSGEESADEQGSTTSETVTSIDDDDEENEIVEHPEERWETCVAGGTKVKLPQILCENPAIFKEMLDYPRFWDECLSESQKESLYSYLPTFPKDCNIEAELDKTLDMLFKRETHRFGVTPLDDFHRQLSAGYFRPDIKKMRLLVKKAQIKKYMYDERKRSYELAGQVLKSRETLLSNAYKQGFCQPSQRSQSKSILKKPKPSIIEDRTQQRYKEELCAMTAELGFGAGSSGPENDSSSSASEDEDKSCSLLTPAQASMGGKLQQQLQILKQQQRRKKRAANKAKREQLLAARAVHLRNSLYNSGDEPIRPICSTLQRLGNECTTGGVLNPSLTSISLKPEPTEESYKKMLIEHKKRRGRKDNHLDLNTQGISLSELMQRTQQGQKHKLNLTSRNPSTKKRKVDSYQHAQQLSVPMVVSNIMPKMESDTNSHTSGDYSLLSTDDLRHNAIEQPDEKPPEVLLATEVPEIKHEIKIEDITEHKYALTKYEIEPPTDQPPPTIMQEGPETDHNDMSSPLANEIKEEIENLDYETNIKLETDIIAHEEIPPAVPLTIPTPPLSMPSPQLQLPLGASSIMPQMTIVHPQLTLPEDAQLSMTIPLQVEDDNDLDKKEEIDLDSIDMMQLPIQLDDGIDILTDVKCEDDNVIAIPEKDLSDSLVDDIVMNGDELMQETHASFFSLIRDAFLSKGEYRMNINEMTDAVILWQDNPISPLNDWYSLVNSWPVLVPLALNFLAGEVVYPQDQLIDGDQEFVPYLENKGQGIYAWIGAGRDSDHRLSMLCSKFLLYKDVLVTPKPPTPPKSTSSLSLKTQAQLQPSATLPDQILESPTSVPDGQLLTDGLAAAVQTEWEPPKALCPTDWKVRPSTQEEKEEFRRQERMRYAAPHKAFTYKMHGYTSVVGPVKGIYQHNAGSGLTKARGHSLLVPDRPNFVTILALVRDATARLPNGEGTRADICMLLKDSQYIQEDVFANDKESNLNSVVSGALDRLHYENDPCVRYYPKRKEWLYLHRARSESEFEMYHQQLQGVPKNKKSSSSAARSKASQAANKAANAKDLNLTIASKESTPKKEKKITVTQSNVTRKELPKKLDEKIVNVVDPNMSTSEQLAAFVQKQQQQQQQKVSPTIHHLVVTTTTATTTTLTLSTSNNTAAAANNISTQVLPSINVQQVNQSLLTTNQIEKECPVTVITTVVEPKQQQITVNSGRELTNMTNLSTTMTNATVKKAKPVAVVKSSGTQSLLQSNQPQAHQPHFTPQQIQVSTSAGLQTIRLSGHSVLHTPAQTSTNVTTLFAGASNAKVAQAQSQSQVITAQPGKSLLQNSNLKQQQQQHVVSGKTLLASQIKLVSSGQIKSLLTGHNIGSQTIFIKPSATTTQTQAGQQSTQVSPTSTSQPQVHQRVISAHNQTQGVQRLIAQIGGKPVAVQIQQSPQQQQQQKVYAKMLTSSGQLMTVESLLAQKGLKLATASSQTRTANKIIPTQYQVVTQAQTTTTQQKIIVSTQAPQTLSQSQTQPLQPQSPSTQQVRMVTAHLAGKPIVLTSSPTAGKTINVATPGSVVLGKQPTTSHAGQQQPIIIPGGHQLLNLKTLHGLKVIAQPAGLKTTGGAVYARVIAPTTIGQPSQSVVVQPPQQQQTGQNSRSASFGGSH